MPGQNLETRAPSLVPSLIMVAYSIISTTITYSICLLHGLVVHLIHVINIMSSKFA
jgi:hypothetical protein